MIYVIQGCSLWSKLILGILKANRASPRGSGPINLIEMAAVIFVISKEKPAERVGTPNKGFDAGVDKYNGCPSDQSDLHGLLCRKTLQDVYLPVVLLRVSAQI